MCEQRARHHRSSRVNYVAYLTPSSFFLKSFSQVSDKGCVEGELPVGSRKGGSPTMFAGWLQGTTGHFFTLTPSHSSRLLEEMTVSLTEPCNTKFIELS